MVEKRFPQARGVGGKPNLGEETEKMEQKNGTGDQENGSRIVRAGVWTVVIKGLGFATASIVRRWMEIICKHLWPPAVGDLPSGRTACGAESERSRFPAVAKYAKDGARCLYLWAGSIRAV